MNVDQKAESKFFVAMISSFLLNEFITSAIATVKLENESHNLPQKIAHNVTE